MLTNLPVPYDLYAGIRISRLFTMHGVNAHLAYCLNSVLNVKCEISSKRFQPGKGPSRSLLRDFEIFAKLRLTFVSSSILLAGAGRGDGLSIRQISEQVVIGVAASPASRQRHSHS